jgi:hypothetical protein
MKRKRTKSDSYALSHLLGLASIALMLAPILLAFAFSKGF